MPRFVQTNPQSVISGFEYHGNSPPNHEYKARRGKPCSYAVIAFQTKLSLENERQLSLFIIEL